MKNKEKYNLSKLEIKSIDTLSGYKIKVFYKDKIIYERTYLADNDNRKLTDFFNWLEQEYKPPILDDVEKAYLSAVIKPFREDVECIIKLWRCSVEKEFIHIFMKDSYDNCTLPDFEKGTMYKNMKRGKRYTLEELGL
jgi:hypothetical protein